MVNKVFLIGNLTRDVELRNTLGGAAVCDIGIAINRTFYSGKEGEKEKKEETTFVDVTVWGRQAETCAEFLEKGRKVHIEGRLSLDTWEDKESGQKRSKLKVTADNVQFLSSAGSNGNSSKPQASPVAAASAPAESDEVPFLIY